MKTFLEKWKVWLKRFYQARVDFPCEGTLVFSPGRAAPSAHYGGQSKLWLQVGRAAPQFNLSSLTLAELLHRLHLLLVGRSVERDLETQMVVVTSNEGLRDRLTQERDALFKFGTPVTAQVGQPHPSLV